MCQILVSVYAPACLFVIDPMGNLKSAPGRDELEGRKAARAPREFQPERTVSRSERALFRGDGPRFPPERIVFRAERP